MRAFFHGNMKHSLASFTVIVSVLAAVTGYFSLGQIYLDPHSIVNSPYIILAWLLSFAVTISIGGGVIGISGKTKCPKCNQKFMFTRKRRRMTGQAIHQGNEVTNYKSDWSCDNCGYTEKNVSEVAERELPPSEE